MPAKLDLWSKDWPTWPYVVAATFFGAEPGALETSRRVIGTSKGIVVYT